MKLERNGEWFVWRWSHGDLTVSYFHASYSSKLYYGKGWWSLWFKKLNIDWESDLEWRCD